MKRILLIIFMAMLAIYYIGFSHNIYDVAGGLLILVVLGCIILLSLSQKISNIIIKKIEKRRHINFLLKAIVSTMAFFTILIVIVFIILIATSF